MKLKIPLIILFVVIPFNNFLAESLSGIPLPKPSGPYAVGSRFFYLTDTDRPDLISPDPQDYRAMPTEAGDLRLWGEDI